MSATTTAICVIVMGTAGGTIRAPLPLAIRYLLGCSQLGAEQVQVPGRVDPVEDGAAAHDDVDTPARDLGQQAPRVLERRPEPGQVRGDHPGAQPRGGGPGARSWRCRHAGTIARASRLNASIASAPTSPPI